MPDARATDTGYVLDPPPVPSVAVPAPPPASRCGASSASAATTPPTRARWGATRTASRRSSSSSPPTPWWTTARRCPTRRRPRTSTTRSSWSWRSGRAASDIPVERALDHVFGYAVGIDLTRRDLQLAAREQGRPWDWGKGFDLSAPIAPLRPVSEVGHPAQGRIWLAVDGQVKQDSDIAKLIWPVPDIISIASRSMELRPGDLIMTGTPEGVGPVRRGEAMTGGIDGLGEIRIGVR